MSDLIERQAAIATAISGRVRTLPTTENGENWIRVSEVRDNLLSLPSTQPERKTGRWGDYIGRDLGIDGQWLRDDGKTVFIQCDQCGSLFVRNFMIHANYCPNCGAKMEVEG